MTKTKFDLIHEILYIKPTLHNLYLHFSVSKMYFKSKFNAYNWTVLGPINISRCLHLNFDTKRSVVVRISQLVRDTWLACPPVRWGRSPCACQPPPLHCSGFHTPPRPWVGPSHPGPQPCSIWNFNISTFFGNGTYSPYICLYVSLNCLWRCKTY